MRKYYIIRNKNHDESNGSHDETHENHESHSSTNESKIAEKVTNKFWDNPEYKEYVKHHGLHFTDSLATWASRKLKNADGSTHMWNRQEISNVLKSMGITLNGNLTIGDVMYLANMYYSDFSQDISDADIFKMVKRMISDPDGYEGMIFVRYTADIMSKNTEVPWKELT